MWRITKIPLFGYLTALLIASASGGEPKGISYPPSDQVLTCTDHTGSAAGQICRTNTVEIHAAWDSHVLLPTYTFFPKGYEPVGEVRGIVTVGDEKYGISGSVIYAARFDRYMVRCEFYAEGSGLPPSTTGRERNGMVAGYCECTAQRSMAAAR
jgi:hypothetical protein